MPLILTYRDYKEVDIPQQRWHSELDPSMRRVRYAGEPEGISLIDVTVTPDKHE